MEPHQIKVRDLNTKKQITRQSVRSYLCGRLTISHLPIFKEFFKSVLEELNPKKGFFSCFYEMHVTVKHDFSTPLTSLEKGSILDSCQHAGAKYINIEGE